MLEMIGTVCWFNNSKGFGFIESEGKQYFVHFSSIRGDGYKMLKQDQTVNFEPTSGPKGLTATEVRKAEQ